MNECENCKLLEEQVKTLRNQKALTDISKKLSEVLKNENTDELLSELMLYRAQALDHFTLAYMAEKGVLPSDIKMLSGYNKHGYYEVFFELKSKEFEKLVEV